MERLTIKAATPETGRAMLAALSEFHAELLESADGCEVVVTLGRNGRDDRDIVAVLNALEQYVTERRRPARVEFHGQDYAMHPESSETYPEQAR